MDKFLSVSECTTAELQELIAMTIELKKLYKSGGRDLCLSGKTLMMLFEKPSLRTRISFEVAMTNLGGHAIYVKPEDIGGIGKREPVKDMARVISRYADAIMARTFEHQTIIEFAQYATVPVINALSDRTHPCQAMADVVTVLEHLGRLEGVTMAYIGDGNNVARSLAFAAAKLRMKLVIASPRGYELDAESIAAANDISAGAVTQLGDPKTAVKHADVIYTDTWVSMGQENEKSARLKEFAGFRVDGALMKCAPRALIMHCLPAYRDCEISDEAMESPNSIVFDQSENRLHFQRALLKKLIVGGGR
ncbi:MAG TPA: ornithine carbamoyltransferase [Sedimentisphaerales bacterium]|nr:ornithine carbamoyltransferase [Sedimentisphaerales bacterium]